MNGFPLNCSELWNICSQKLQTYFDEETFGTWIKPIIPKEFKNNTLSIEVPSNFFYEWISDHYSGVIIQTLTKICGFNVKLTYLIKKTDVKQIKNTDSTRKILNNHLSFIKKNFSNIDDISGLNPKYTFDNFIEGACNQLAKSAAESVAGKPLGNLLNPLTIYSDVGLGKTHLLHAIGNKIKQNFKNKIVVLIPTTIFVDQFINSTKANNIQEFSRFYRDIDVLLLDDIQFLKDKIKTQENLFFIFNQFHELGKQMVFTSDKYPNNLDGLQERLISRFMSGLTADINVPDLETKIAILKSKFSDNYDVPSSVLEYIAQRVNSNIRELEGVMITAITNASFQHDINIVSIQKIINKVASNDLIVDRISNVVASYFNISIEEILGKSRQKDVSLARQIAMYFAKKYTKCSLKKIGSLIGSRDHSTVIHAVNTISELMKDEKKIKNIIYAINKRIIQKTAEKI